MRLLEREIFNQLMSEWSILTTEPSEGCSWWSGGLAVVGWVNDVSDELWEHHSAENSQKKPRLPRSEYFTQIILSGSWPKVRLCEMACFPLLFRENPKNADIPQIFLTNQNATRGDWVAF